MKKKHKILLVIIGIEFLIISFLDKLRFRCQSWIENAVETFLFFLPIQLLLYSLSKEDSVPTKTQMLCKLVFWFIWICYLVGGVVSQNKVQYILSFH